MPVPLAPTLTTPDPNTYLDNVASSIVFGGIYNTGGSGPQTAYALRISVDGAAYSWWNGTALVGAETFVTSSTLAATIGTGVIGNSHTVAWSFASQDSGGTGPYAVDEQFSTAVIPSVTITAPSGTVSSGAPTATWTDTISTGSQISFRVIYYTDAETLASGWNAGDPPADPDRDSGVVSSPVTTWTPSIVVNPGVYHAYVQIVQTNGIPSLWVGSTFTVTYSAPATPTLTATLTSDITTNEPIVNLVATSSSIDHMSIFASDDGGATWAVLSVANRVATTTSLSRTDRTIPLGATRQYRAQSYSGSTVSGYSTVQSITPAGQCILSDPLDATMILFLNRFPSGSAPNGAGTASFELISHEPMGIFYGWGNRAPIVQRTLSRLATLEVDIYIEGYTKITTLRRMVGWQAMPDGSHRNRTLLLRTDMGNAWLIAIGPDISIAPLKASDRAKNPKWAVKLPCSLVGGS